MPSKITCRYFQVLREGNVPRSFADALGEVAAIPQLADRTRTVDDHSYRLERHAVEDGLVRCEIVKIESDNLPAEVTPIGLDELDADQIGYGIAFCYDPATSVIAMQYDNRIVSGSKICRYLRGFSAHNNFYLKLIPGPSLWAEFGDGTVTRFQIRVASPQAFQGEFGSEVEESVSRLSRAYDAPYVSIGLSVGHRNARLRDVVKESATGLMAAWDLTSMKAKIVESPEEIDLLEEVLGDRETITIPKNPDESYRARSDFVVRSFIGRQEYLQQFIAQA